MNMRKSWIITVLVIICATAAAVSHPKLIHHSSISPRYISIPLRIKWRLGRKTLAVLR